LFVVNVHSVAVILSNLKLMTERNIIIQFSGYCDICSKTAYNFVHDRRILLVTVCTVNWWYVL